MQAQTELKPLSPQEVDALIGEGTVPIDMRGGVEFGEEFIPGSVNIMFSRRHFGERVNILVPLDATLVLISDQDEQFPEALAELQRVGFQNIAGYLKGSVEAWKAAGLPVQSLPQISALELSDLLEGSDADLAVLDVREPFEWDQGIINGAMLISLGDVAERYRELDPEKPVAVTCAGGIRSSSAASFLARQGFKRLYNVTDGMYGWQRYGCEVTFP